MNQIAISPASTSSSPSDHTVSEKSYDALSKLYKEHAKEVSEFSSAPEHWSDGTQQGVNLRREWLRAKENRENVIVDKDWMIEAEFGNGLIGKSTECCAICCHQIIAY